MSPVVAYNPADMGANLEHGRFYAALEPDRTLRIIQLRDGYPSEPDTFINTPPEEAKNRLKLVKYNAEIRNIVLRAGSAFALVFAAKVAIKGLMHDDDSKIALGLIGSTISAVGLVASFSWNKEAEIADIKIEAIDDAVRKAVSRQVPLE